MPEHQSPLDRDQSRVWAAENVLDVIKGLNTQMTILHRIVQRGANGAKIAEVSFVVRSI